MNKPRTHVELIKAWADGAEIEWRDDSNDTWRATGDLPGWHRCRQYRVKPPPQVSQKYRRYLMKPLPWVLNRQPITCVLTYDGTKAWETVPQHPDFIKWIDTEWQQHEYTLSP